MEIAFDTRTRTPIYVMERLGGLSRKNEPTKRRARFHEEVALPTEFRSRNGYYRGSGYDRGHLAPAADFPPDMEKDTYTLCNTIPQVPSMNRHGWAQLEAFVRKVAEREWNENQSTTYVVTGPLWLPSCVSEENPGVFHYSYRGLGTPPALISVPTHLFKVVAVVRNNAIEKFAAFVIANKEMEGGRVDLAKYLVRLSDLEAVCGMHFFPEMQDFRQYADALTDNVWTKMRVDRRQILLLMDGDNQKSASKKNEVVVWKASKLYHLCDGGKCQ
jgi:DNA/RNA endonuclease G (NUC1)